MNQQPEALRIANEYRPTMGLDVVRLWAPDAVAELRRQHAEIEAFHNIAEGCTPADAYILREANHALAIEVEALRRDAERWRFAMAHWLRADFDFHNDAANKPKSMTISFRFDRDSTKSGSAIESFIDAAREEKT